MNRLPGLVFPGMLLGLCVALLSSADVSARAPMSPASQGPMDLVTEVFRLVLRDYVERVDDQVLVDAAIRGLLTELDPHAALLDGVAYADMRINTSGRDTGIGLELGVDSEHLVVTATIEDGPAEAAGLQPGDILLSINGYRVEASGLAGAKQLLRGESGSEVVLEIHRPGAATSFSQSLVRRPIERKTVRGRLLSGGQAYVSVSDFTDGTADELHVVINRLVQQAGEPLPGLVLDLRDNRGGVLEAATAVADAFLDGGLILVAEGRSADARFRVEAQPGDLLSGAPMSVLVNRGSASAAEIVAGALQDSGRAVVVGETTYGKGSVQSIIPLSDGRAIIITTSQYYTPAGRSIETTGIRPDIRAVEAGRNGADAVLEAAVKAITAPRRPGAHLRTRSTERNTSCAG